MYESLPLGEVDSRVGHIARHEKDKAKNADGIDQEQEDSEVPPLLHISLQGNSNPCQLFNQGQVMRSCTHTAWLQTTLCVECSLPYDCCA